ncbi:hypothetical protein [Streptomyces sp. ODS05-4]|uniref:hypothetical protein n=1 Tax=Streptomyces sp. ODS05-4 TaxID=2944939 RepID=UPI00210E748E|nr:hypothetical protein [Streptomyces sp. ODS05-4]
MKSDEHPLIRDYLTTAESELAVLPADRREEALARLAACLRAAVLAADAHGDLEIRRVLDDFGAPEQAVLPELTDELRARDDSRVGWTLILLALAGPLFVTVWPAGLAAAAVSVYQLWSSDRWRPRERVLGTLAPFAGPALAVLVGYAAAAAPSGFGRYTVLTAPLLALCVPVAISGYLYLSLRRRAAADGRTTR